MVLSRTITTFCLISGYIVIGLSGCSSKTDTFALKENQERWFCTPQGEDDWSCDESKREFEQLAKQNKFIEEEQKESTVPVDTDTDLTSPTLIAKELTNEQAQQPERLSERDISAQENSAQEKSTQETGPAELSNAVSEPELASSATVDKLLDAPAEETERHDIELERVSETSMAENKSPVQATVSTWVVQLGAYGSEAAADELAQKVGQGDVFKTQVRGRFYFTVVATGFSQKSEAEQLAREIERRQLGISPWIRKGASLQKFIVD